jgi:hypothetical protein
MPRKVLAVLTHSQGLQEYVENKYCTINVYNILTCKIVKRCIIYMLYKLGSKKRGRNLIRYELSEEESEQAGSEKLWSPVLGKQSGIS